MDDGRLHACWQPFIFITAPEMRVAFATLIFYMGIRGDGIRKGVPSEGWGKIESWRAIFSPWENP